MAYQDYGAVRWKLFFGSDESSAVLKKAIEETYGAVRSFLPYILTVCQSEEDIGENDNVIFVGTLKSNPALLKLAALGFYTPQNRREGFSICVGASLRPVAAERTDIVIQGADDVGTLYGVYTFETAYLDTKLKYYGYHYETRLRPFIDPCPAFTLSEAPAIANRGLWTWGHRIFDYRNYFENMARCRMNTVIIWNDFVPLNARDMVACAHGLGIKVIWGYSCAWGENVKVDPTNEEEMNNWSRRVLETYDKEYLPVGGDGVYFQGFTETTATEVGGVPIADLIAKWINRVTAALKQAHPDLYVQFGIHASSIRENWDRLRLSADVTPVWEDCGGFPYHYDPRTGNASQALAYTENLLGLAGKGGRFGTVLKGFTVLKWKQFEHYRGDIIAGVTDPVACREYRKTQDFYWRFVEPYWIYHLEDLKRYCRAVTGAELSDAVVTALVEDGAFEVAVPRAVALLGEVLWNWQTETEEILERVYQSERYGTD